jgi:hypothetical protein
MGGGEWVNYLERMWEGKVMEYFNMLAIPFRNLVHTAIHPADWVS